MILSLILLLLLLTSPNILFTSINKQQAQGIKLSSNKIFKASSSLLYIPLEVKIKVWSMIMISFKHTSSQSYLSNNWNARSFFFLDPPFVLFKNSLIEMRPSSSTSFIPTIWLNSSSEILLNRNMIRLLSKKIEILKHKLFWMNEWCCGQVFKDPKLQIVLSCSLW